MSDTLGIDVSRWQTSTPSLSGLSFLIARASNNVTVDASYPKHIANARAAGLVVGAYHYAGRATIRSQVDTFLKRAGDVGLLFLDVESNNIPWRDGAAFIKEVQSRGRTIGLYASASVFRNIGQDYDWVAFWSTKPPTRHWDFWQYRGTPLDLDRFNGTVEQLRALAGEGSDTVDSFPVPKVPSDCSIVKGVKLYYDTSLTSDSKTITVDPGRRMPYFGAPVNGVDMVEYVNDKNVHTGETRYAHSADIKDIRPIVIPTDCSKEVLAAKQAEYDRVTTAGDIVIQYPPRP